MVTRRKVMNAYGKYLNYIEHLAKIKRGEEDGSIAAFARAVAALEQDYKELQEKFVSKDDEATQ